MLQVTVVHFPVKSSNIEQICPGTRLTPFVQGIINSDTADACADALPALHTFKLDCRQKGPLQALRITRD